MKISKVGIFIGLMIFGVITTWQYSSQGNELAIDPEMDQIVRDSIHEWTDNDMVYELSNDLRFDNFLYQLIQNNQNINDFVSDTDATFLHIAVRLNDVQKSETLLDLGANVNAQDDSGWTALHFAIANGLNCTLDMVQLLIAAGADITLENSQGFTPIDLLLTMSNNILPSIKGYLLSLVGPQVRFGVTQSPNFSQQIRPINRDERSFTNMQPVSPTARRPAAAQDELSAGIQELSL